MMYKVVTDDVVIEMRNLLVVAIVLNSDRRGGSNHEGSDDNWYNQIEEISIAGADNNS